MASFKLCNKIIPETSQPNLVYVYMCVFLQTCCQKGSFIGLASSSNEVEEEEDISVWYFCFYCFFQAH